MLVLIDTNILISAVLGGATPFAAYVKAVSYPKNQKMAIFKKSDPEF